MNLDDVVVFVTVDEHSSFSAAARQLGLSRVAVSRSVSRLETSIGARLMMRTSRHVWLTSAGREFRDKVKEHIASLSGAVRDFSGRDLKPAGRIRVGATAEVAAMCLAPTIARFAEENPGIRLELQHTNTFLGTMGDTFDVVLGFPDATEQVELRPSTSRYVGAAICGLFAAPAYLERHGAPESPNDLVRHAQVSALASALEKSDAAKLLPPAAANQSIACTDMYLALELIRLGCGIGLLPRALAEREVASGALVPVLSEVCEARLHLWLLCSPGSRLTALTSAFCEYVIDDLRRRQLVVV